MFPALATSRSKGPPFVRRLNRGRKRQIQGLRPSGGKNNIFGRDPSEGRQFGSGKFDHGPRGSPFGMNRGSVAAKIEGRAHCLARRRVQRRRGIMIKVDTRR